MFDENGCVLTLLPRYAGEMCRASPRGRAVEAARDIRVEPDRLADIERGEAAHMRGVANSASTLRFASTGRRLTVGRVLATRKTCVDA
jgi:hypothetical protein